MLNLERLRALQAVAEHGSVSGAAEALHVTTSAVSQQLAKLERETRERLLIPNGRGVRLTDVANLLVEHGKRILSLVEEAEADLEAHRDAVFGRLRLATFATAARGFLPPVLRELRERYPRLTVEMSEMVDANETLPLLQRGDVELAVVNDWDNAPLELPCGLSHEYLLHDWVDIALPADHPLAERDAVDLAELGGEQWIAWTRGSVCHAWLRSTLRAAGVEPTIAHTAEEHPTQLALVAAGLGAAMIPRIGRDLVPPGVRMIDMRPTLARRFYVVWRCDATRRPAVQAGVAAMREAAKEYEREPAVAA